MYYKKIFCREIAEYFDYIENLRPWYITSTATVSELNKAKKDLKKLGEAIYKRAGSPAMNVAYSFTWPDMQRFVSKSWEGVGIWMI